MKISLSLIRASLIFALAVASLAGKSTVASEPESGPDPEVVAAGERLVQLLDCNACHTPKMFTAQGPQQDASRLLSGHPADEKLASIPDGLIGPDGWGGVFNHGLTAWAGPWGISFATNLSPDIETGIGSWTEDVFREALRTGTHVEKARPFLPPMPRYPRLTDDELHAMFMYLHSIEPIHNAVPESRPAAVPMQEK